MSYSEEPNYFSQALEDFFHDQSQHEYRINKIAIEIVGCPYDIIDDILDEEQALYCKQRVLNLYNERY